MDPVKSFIYADDKTIYMRGNDIDVIEGELQLTVDLAVEWAEAHGFRFSPEKTVLVHFTRRRPRRRPLKPPIIQMHGKRIRQVKTHKILGLTFDERLTWRPHMNDIRKRVQLRMRLLRSLATTKYGADQDIFLRTFMALLVTTIEFGSSAYGSAKPRILHQLQILFN